MLTVKQLSDRLNVSKQTINNNVPNDMSYKKIKGINYIDEQLEIAITNNINRNKNRFGYDSTQSEDIQHENTSSNDELVKQLRSEIELLHNQLAIKDNQIEHITQALTNQQLLHREASNNNQLSNTNRDNKENKNSNISQATYSVHSDTNKNTTERSSSTTNNGSVSNNDPSNIDISQEQSSVTKETDTDINKNMPPKKKSLISRLFNR